LYSFISRDEAQKIHYAAMEVLNKTGVLVDDPNVMELLKDAGAHVDVEKRIARIPEYVVKEGIRKAPGSFVLHSRGKHRYRIGEERMYTATGGGALTMLDLRTGEHRPSVMSDIEETCRLVDALENIDIYEPLVYPHDIGKDSVDVLAVDAVLRNTSKPYRVLTHEHKYLKTVIEMAAIVAGGMEELEKKPIFVGGGSTTSPLRLGLDELEVTRMLAEHRIPNVIMPCPISGVTSPISVAGTLVILIAEVLSMVLVAELTNPGTPMVVGPATSIMDMRTSTASMGSPEGTLAAMAFTEMAHFYHLPSWVPVCATDALVPDAQAGYESAWTSLFPFLGRASVGLGAGMMNAAIAVSCEKLVMDNEILGAMRRITRGIDFSERSLALDVIETVGPAGNFLAQRHTKELLRQEQWLPRVSNRSGLQEWKKKSLDLWKKSAEEALKILSTHQPEPIEREKEKALSNYVKQYERNVTT
jgi:trimethylamine--corrinoid protein Co-methyltransferase